MKYYILFFSFCFLIGACKVQDNLQNKGPVDGLTKVDKPQRTNVENQSRPQDLLELIKEMALTEPEEKSFLDTYAFYGREMSSVVSQKFDKETQNVKLALLKGDRDKEIMSKLNSEQKIMYKKYLSDVRKRRIIDDANGNKTRF